MEMVERVQREMEERLSREFEVYETQVSRLLENLAPLRAQMMEYSKEAQQKEG
jgi:hypothetical protein